MAYPRACAAAEVDWTDPKLKNWADFSRRLEVHLERLKAQGVHYRAPRPTDPK
jgi:hexosaminidase